MLRSRARQASGFAMRTGSRLARAFCCASDLQRQLPAHVGALDAEEALLCADATACGEAAELSGGGDHAVAGNDNRAGIMGQRLPDLARQVDVAQARGNLAVRERLARRDGA